MFTAKPVAITLPDTILDRAQQLAQSRHMGGLGTVTDKQDFQDQYYVDICRILGRLPDDTDHERLSAVVGDAAPAIWQRYFKGYHRWGYPYAYFREYRVPGKMEKVILSSLPKCLRDMQPKIAVQVCHLPGVITPHRDHFRKTSVLFILDTNDEHTVWWQTVRPYQEFDNWLFADLDCIQEADRQTLHPGKTYVVNQAALHSVHPTKDTNDRFRSAICVEFHQMSADELYQSLAEFHIS